MRRSPLAIAVVLIAALAVTGCTAPSPESTESVSAAPVATPTPTPEVLLVGPGEQPPTVFGGDCSAMISIAELSGALGYDVTELTSGGEWSRSISTAGGLVCQWDGGHVAVIPRVGLGEVALPEGTRKYYFERCDWLCAWVWENESLWISGADGSVKERTRDEVDAIAATVGPLIAARWAETGDPQWDRSRDGWWPAFPCDQLATAVGSQLGAAVTGTDDGYVDPVGAATEFGDAAMHLSWCALSDDAGTRIATIQTAAGVAWSAPWREGYQPVALGVPGLTAHVSLEPVTNEYGRSYLITDGVNVANASATESERWSEQQIAVAIAAAAASGFQP